MIRGFLVYVPFENAASWEAGNGGAPDKVTVATEPGKLAGPFKVVLTDQGEPDPPHGARRLHSVPDGPS